MSNLQLSPSVINLANAIPERHATFWLQIGHGQITLAATLQAIELRYSGKLSELARATGETTQSYQARLSAGLAELRKIADEAVNARKGYTTHLDAAKEACMKIEKLLAASPEYATLAATELALRKELQAASEASANLERERNAFRLHFVNQFDSLAADLRRRCGELASTCYTQALQTRMPVEGVPEWVKEHEAAIAGCLLGKPAGFTRVLLTPEEATTIYNSIQQPNAQAIQDAAISELREKFATYASDLANAEAAIRHETETFQATVVEAAKGLEQQAAVNTLLATSQSFAIANGPEVKVKEAIDVKGLTIPEATAIQAAFLLHGAKAWSKVKAAPERVTIAQQAAALDAIGVYVEGVRYSRVEK